MHELHTALLQHSAWLWRMSGKLLIVLIITLLFFLVANLTKALIVRISGKAKMQHPGFQFVGNFCKVTIILIGFITALGTVGINVSAIVASLGLTGFALGFALKDFLSNILSGLTILIYQPYKLGDTITIPRSSSSNLDFTGKVAEINLRYTVLISKTNERILIPNTSITTNAVVIAQ